VNFCYGPDEVVGSDAGRFVAFEEDGRGAFEVGCIALCGGLIGVSMPPTNDVAFAEEHRTGRYIGQSEADRGRDTVTLHPDDLTCAVAVFRRLHGDGHRSQPGATALAARTLVVAMALITGQRAWAPRGGRGGERWLSGYGGECRPTSLRAKA
jgi:hypothetical protein